MCKQLGTLLGIGLACVVACVVVVCPPYSVAAATAAGDRHGRQTGAATAAAGVGFFSVMTFFEEIFSSFVSSAALWHVVCSRPFVFTLTGACPTLLDVLSCFDMGLCCVMLWQCVRPWRMSGAPLPSRRYRVGLHGLICSLLAQRISAFQSRPFVCFCPFVFMLTGACLALLDVLPCFSMGLRCVMLWQCVRPWRVSGVWIARVDLLPACAANFYLPILFIVASS